MKSTSISSHLLLSHLPKNVVSKEKNGSENDICHLLSQVGQTSKGRSFQLASCRPPLSAQRTRKGGPQLVNVFWVQHNKGDCEAFCTGGVLKMRTLEWKLRM